LQVLSKQCIYCKYEHPLRRKKDIKVDAYGGFLYSKALRYCFKNIDIFVQFEKELQRKRLWGIKGKI
jgi:hypothetical protein